MSKAKTTKPAPAPEAPAPAPAAAPPAPEANGFGGRKTVCPVTRAGFRAAAKQLIVDVGGSRVAANPKEFSTGSFGWYANGKVDVLVGDVLVTCQVSLNLTVVGSKALPQE